MEKSNLLFGAFGKTTGWAMVFCVAGIVSIFVPWVEVYGGWGFDFTGQRNGLVTWHGVVTGVLFAVLFLFLVATSPLEPVPLWRSITLGVAGALALLVTGLFIGRYAAPPLAVVLAGAYLALGLGFGLVFLAALEIRGMLVRVAMRRRVMAVIPEGKGPVPQDPEAVAREGHPPTRAEETRVKDDF
jgi:hypothetical protein